MERLRQELAAARAKDGVFLEEERYHEMVATIDGHATTIEELEDVLDQRMKEMEELKELFEDTSEQLENTKGELATTQVRKIVRTKALGWAGSRLDSSG